MVIRALILALLAAIGVVASVAQIDRQARRTPVMAQFVPNAWGGFAAEHQAGAAIARGDGAEAQRLSATLVRHRPMRSEHLRLLAQACAMNGDDALASAAIGAAAQLGWRDGLTQRAMIELAIARGDHADAARRFAALRATGSPLAGEDGLAAQVFAHPRARQELRRLLQENPRWATRWTDAELRQLRIAPD